MAKIKSFGVAVTVASNTIGGLKSVDIPEAEVTDIDITTHDSAGGFREYTGGLKDGGTVTMSGAYDIANTGQAYLRNPANQGAAPVACVVTFSDDSTASFNAVVKGYGITNPLDENVEFTASLKVSGPVTYAAGA
jgi:predicted secreted protein